MFQKVDAYAGDPILSLMERFKEDPRSDKVNLSIGLYYNDDGIIPQLQAVAEAEARLNAEPHGASLYLPMEGLSGYRQAIAPLLFGAEHTALKQNRIASIQTVGGSGALKVGADFLKRYFPESHVWVSDPTWENHIAIFEGAGFEVSTYPWFDKATNGVRFEDLLATLQTLPARDIVLLHPCCHNPTGADLTPAQWDRVVEVLKARQLIPFLDIAYQGFGGGLEEDAYAIRAIASAGMPMLVSNSFSKIFSLYGERVGGLSVVCEDSETAGRVLGQLKATVRRNYSSPPSFGAQVVATVLNDAALKATWQAEVDAMRAPGCGLWQKCPGWGHNAGCARKGQATMVQKENRGGFRARIIVSAVEAVQRIIPQRMPERSGMGAYLMAGTTANTATRKGQPHAMKLRIFVKRGQVELWAVKVIEGQKFRPARPARVALQHPAFVALVCAQGPPDRKVFL